MKKILFLFVFFSSATTLFAQKSELKLDLFDIIAFRTLDIAYEYQLNDEASAGISAFMNFAPKSSDFRYNEDFQLVPYFRQFLADTNGFDFFGEVFGSFNFGQNKFKQNYSDFALGLGGGAKHISKNGYIFEINMGVGRNLFNTSISKQVVPRFGISLGKQF